VSFSREALDLNWKTSPTVSPPITVHQKGGTRFIASDYLPRFRRGLFCRLHEEFLFSCGQLHPYVLSLAPEHRSHIVVSERIDDTSGDGVVGIIKNRIGA
jgi:hypothetical protein